MSGGSHQPAFMGDCLTISHMAIAMSAGEWMSFCVPGTIEVDGACV